MSRMSIWCGLEREMRGAGSARVFTRIKENHPVLQAYASLGEAVRSVTPKDESHREAVLAALIAKYRARPEPVLGAALALAMRPLLVPLMSSVAARGGDDADATVFAAFLESASRLRSLDRIALRLYSETRRRALRSLRAGKAAEAMTDHAIDVDAIEPDDVQPIESVVDQVRFVRRALRAPLQAGESVAAYAIRVRGLRSAPERRAVKTSLRFERTARWDDIREEIQAVA